MGWRAFLRAPLEDARDTWAALTPRVRLAGGAVLALAAVLRLQEVAYGLPFPYRADEPVYVHLAGRVARELDPGWVLYPHLYVNLLCALFGVYFVGLWLRGVVASPAAFKAYYLEHPTGFYLAGRLVSVGAGVGSLALTLGTGVRFLGGGPGLAAAAVGALHWQHFSVSRFAKADALLLPLAALTVRMALQVLLRGRRADHLWAGIWSGLAASSLYNGALLALAPLVAFGLRRASPGEEDLDAVPPTLAELGRATMAGVAAFALTSPFVLLSPKGLPSLVGHLARMSGEKRGRYLVGEGTRGMTRIVGALREQVGDPALLLLCLGCLAPFLLALRGRSGAAVGGRPAWQVQAVLLAPLAGKLLVFGSLGHYGLWRYALPGFLPALLAAFWGIDRLLAGVEGPWGRRLRVAVPAGVVLLAWSASGPRILRQLTLEGRADTRTLAREWVIENVPAGSKVLMENNIPPIKSYAQGGGVPSLERYDTVTLPNYHSTLFGGGEWVARTNRQSPTPEEIRERGFDFVIVNGWNEAAYQELGEVFAPRLAFYRRLREGFPTAYRVEPEGERLGPRIEVFRVTPAQGGDAPLSDAGSAAGAP